MRKKLVYGGKFLGWLGEANIIPHIKVRDHSNRENPIPLRHSAQRLRVVH